MTRYLAAAFAAALVAAVASFTYAQTPPSTDRKAGEEGTVSAKPDMDKKTGGTTKGTTGAKGTTPPPPSTDRPGGEEGATSAKPDPDKKR